MKKKYIYLISLTLIVFSLIFGIKFYVDIFGANTKKSGSLYIETNSSFVEVLNNISPFIENLDSFEWVADIKKFYVPKAGRYIIKDEMSNNDIINLLRSGNQTPVKVLFNNQNSLEKFSKRISEQLEIDSLSIIKAFLETSFLKQNNLNPKNVLQICIPNSYEFYWNTSAKKFRNRMLNEYNKFWTKDRVKKANNIKLSKNQVITLASIVQKETSKKSERPTVAGLYLNRLNKNWPLQADPTIIYCIKQLKGENYEVKRVLNKDLEIDSPYNTYKNVGLPPSLISMPDISSIDAVLNPEKHNYFYMCASIEKIGYHKFSKTLAQHNRNAAKYQNWLTKVGINR